MNKKMYLKDSDVYLEIIIFNSKTMQNHQTRKLPFAQRSKVKKELDRMVRDGVIEPVNEPSDWVNSIVVAEKTNKRCKDLS